MSWVIAGIEFAALGPDGEPGTDDEAHVINMSLGSPMSRGDGTDPGSLAVDFATEHGLVVAVAAGNEGPDMSSVGIPGVARSAITVGASNHGDGIATFSSRGPAAGLALKPEVVAPGVGIVAPRPGGGQAVLSGTSMATPRQEPQHSSGRLTRTGTR